MGNIGLIMENDIKKIGKNIKRLRLAKGMTQLDLAAECAMEYSNIARIEAGNTNPTVRTLLKIARALGISLSELVKYK